MNITQLICRFRIASRELFNNFFSVPDPYDNDGWTLEERFREVESVLFQQLVAVATGISEVRYGDLQPDIFVTLSCGEFAPIMINRDESGGYWDFPITQVDSSARLGFVSFFDWDVLRCRDNQFVRVKILGWDSYPECVGKHALIDATNVAYHVAAGVPSVERVAPRP